MSNPLPHRSGRRSCLRWGLSLALLAGLTACKSGEPRYDPTVVIEGSAGKELGVATEYGVVFLGRTARSGRVRVTAWFNDGPSFETGIVERVGGNLYSTETEIRLPNVRLGFNVPRPGTAVTVRGRKGSSAWETTTEVARDERVDGLILKSNATLRGLGDDQTGAGVFVGGGDHPRLVGLVSGRLRLEDAGGDSSEYLTVYGPEELWRLVAYRRDLVKPPRWTYREDVW